MQGLGLQARSLLHPLGSPAGRRREGDARRSGPQDRKDGVDQGGLADAGAAGDHQHLGAQRQPHRFPLAGSQDQAGFLLDPRYGLVRVDRGPGWAALGQPEQPLGDALLGAVEPGQEQARAIPDRVGHHGTFGPLQRDRRIHHLGGDLQQRRRQLAQLVHRQAAMALVHGLGQGVADPGPGADHGRLLDPEPHRDLIGTLEADAPDVAGEAVGVLRDDLHGIGTVGLEDPHGARGADAMAVQEQHDLADHLLLGPAGADPQRRAWARCRRPPGDARAPARWRRTRPRRTSAPACWHRPGRCP